jgi:transcriptional regulator with XRE-family HTH domain
MRFRLLKPRRDVASAEQVRTLRERRQRQGWTVEQLADEVHASPLELSAWEAGVVRVPAGQALRIQWMEDVDLWHAAREAAAARACPWVRENAPDLYERMFGDPAGSWHADSALTRQHLAGCATCQDVWKRAQEAGGFPVEPDMSPEGPRTRFDRWVARLPRWVRALFSFTGLLTQSSATAFFIYHMPARDAGFWAHVYGVGFGALAGVIALTTAGFAVARVTRRPEAALVPGLAAGAAGLLGWAMLDAAVDLRDPLPWAVAVATGVAIGVAGAWGVRASARRTWTPPDPEAMRSLLGSRPPEWPGGMRLGPAFVRTMVEELRSRQESAALPAERDAAGPPDPVGRMQG